MHGWRGAKLDWALFALARHQSIWARANCVVAGESLIALWRPYARGSRRPASASVKRDTLLRERCRVSSFDGFAGNPEGSSLVSVAGPAGQRLRRLSIFRCHPTAARRPGWPGIRAQLESMSPGLQDARWWLLLSIHWRKSLRLFGDQFVAGGEADPPPLCSGVASFACHKLVAAAMEAKCRPLWR